MVTGWLRSTSRMAELLRAGSAYPLECAHGRSDTARILRRHTKTRSGVIGNSSRASPRASLTAFARHAGAPIVADPPIPLTPPGVRGEGVSRWTIVTGGIYFAVGSRQSMNVVVSG